MDRYEEKADSYDQLQDYYECVAMCPEGKDCHCDKQPEASPQMWLAFVIVLLIWPGVLVWGGLLMNFFEKIKDKKEEKKKLKSKKNQKD